jgi:hypothetical protein
MLLIMAIRKRNARESKKPADFIKTRRKMAC